uniref:Uncharacterized protein n=1 Tax=Salmo trutta TaxID=8032 RepID=A0A674DF03_SALTR
MLESYIDKVLCGQKGVRFFFPLWESYMGHSKLTYSEEVVPAIPTAKVYKSSDGKISLYQCDLYKFSRILDRGSLYDHMNWTSLSLIMSLMDKDCRYHLDTFLYNPVLFKGTIFPEITAEIIFLIQSSNALPEVKDKEWGLDVFIESSFPHPKGLKHDLMGFSETTGSDI